MYFACLTLKQPGLPGFQTKTAKLLLKTSSVAFRVGPPINNVFWGVKYTFLAGVPLVKFTLTRGNSVKATQFCGQTTDLATLNNMLYQTNSPKSQT